MTSSELVRRLYGHQRWSNRRLVDACRGLTIEQLHRQFHIGQGTALATLTHLYAAEFVWVAAIEGEVNPISPFDIRLGSVEAIASAWAALEIRWDTIFSTLADADLDRPVAKMSTSSGAGKVWTTPLADVLLHVSTHAQYTAAQLKNMLRQLGVTPLPDVMLISMSRGGE